MGYQRPQTPKEAWAALLEGNRHFVSGEPAHPRQDVDRRESVAEIQRPFAALFGCADSRLSAEIIFDVGLGDLFVVRNAGQVIAETILGSLEYAVEVLKVPLILVLGHDECGAIRATISAQEGTLQSEGEFIHNIVARIEPTVTKAYESGKKDIDEITELHIHDTIDELMSRSTLIAKAVKEGKLGVVGANYKLALGEIHPLVTHGEIV
ncbi:MAG: carbonic anhydrase [Rhodoluna sp.]|jgi:carbonic anhydrase|nr:carbonic anhydrase [Rhodoluna sp.]